MMAVDLPKVDLPEVNRTALLIVDAQLGFDDNGVWGPRDNPTCQDNVAALPAARRTAGRLCLCHVTRPTQLRR